MTEKEAALTAAVEAAKKQSLESLEHLEKLIPSAIGQEFRILFLVETLKSQNRLIYAMRSHISTLESSEQKKIAARSWNKDPVRVGILWMIATLPAAIYGTLNSTVSVSIEAVLWMVTVISGTLLELRTRETPKSGKDN